MEIKWLVWLNFIILSETLVVADLIFAKTKHIQKSAKKIELSGRAHCSVHPSKLILTLEVNVKLAKALLLGSAASLVAIGGTLAADLPTKKAAPVESHPHLQRLWPGLFLRSRHRHLHQDRRQGRV